MDKLVTPNTYSNYDALILDMDGTLIDSGQLHEKAWISALEHFSIPVDRALMRSLAGVPTEETVARLLLHFKINISATPKDVREYKETKVNQHVFDYIKPTALAQLVEQSYGRQAMAVGTGALTSSAIALLEACDLKKYIDYIVGADQVDAHKPEPDTFLRCAQLLNVKPENCVVFEYSPLGLEAAKRAGMNFVEVEKDLGIVNNYF